MKQDLLQAKGTMRKDRGVTRLRRTPRVSVIIGLLNKERGEVTEQASRDYLTSVIQALQQGITDAKPASKTVPTKTEQQLWAADLAEHGFRSVGRLLAAGHAFTFLDNTPKRQCLKDFQKLLGHYFDMSTFPVKGGRQVIAGVLTSMLGFQVSLMMIEKWFPKPASQKMVIHQELARLLSNRGMSWPPNAASFEQCPSYRTIQRPGKQTLDTQASVRSSTAPDDSSTCILGAAGCGHQLGLNGSLVQEWPLHQPLASQLPSGQPPSDWHLSHLLPSNQASSAQGTASANQGNVGSDDSDSETYWLHQVVTSPSTLSSFELQHNSHGADWDIGTLWP